MAAERAIHRLLISCNWDYLTVEHLFEQEEEISAKPQLMGDFLALTPTSCANRTPVLEGFCDGMRRVEVNTSPMAHLPAKEK